MNPIIRGTLPAAWLAAALLAGPAPSLATPITADPFATFLPNSLSSSTIPSDGDVNPYGVAIVPGNFPSGGAIEPGDVLVSNFNNSNNVQGTGTTIIKLTPGLGQVATPGNATTFFQGANLGLTTALGVLQRGFVLVGNVPTANGLVVSPGSLLILDKNGNPTGASPVTTQLNGPWDLTLFDEGSRALVFVSNLGNNANGQTPANSGFVTRLTLAVSPTGVTVTNAAVIATGYSVVANGAALVLGPTGLAYAPLTDTLYVASTNDNEVFAVQQASRRTSANGTGTVVFADPHLRGPLGLTFATNGNLLAANGDAVNADPAHPSEIVEFTPAGRFVREFNVDQAQGGAFGLAVSIVGNVSRFAYVDDVVNTITVVDQPLVP